MIFGENEGLGSLSMMIYSGAPTCLSSLPPAVAYIYMYIQGAPTHLSTLALGALSHPCHKRQLWGAPTPLRICLNI